MRKHWLLLVLAAFIALAPAYQAQAQGQKDRYRNKANDPVAKLPYYKKLRWADGLFRDGSYFNAAEYYQQLLQEQPRNPYLTYQLAECYLFSRDYVLAAQYYRDAYALAPKIYPEAIYKEADMLKMQGLYDSSISKFNKFIADNPKTFKKLKKRAQRQIEGANMGKASVNDPQAVTIKNAGPNVNSAYTELSPYPLGDTALLFSTMRQNSEVETDKRRRSEYVARFQTSHKQYHVPEVDSFQWPLAFEDGKFNDPRVHTGNGSYSPGGDRFYFTRCSDGDTLSVLCKIYVSKFETKTARWGNPEVLGEGINETGSNTQPYCAKVGKKEVLFFSSNRKLGSRGGYDIYYSIIDPARGTYRRPQNCGKTINTESDEVTPYYDSRVNKLYFASNGLVSMGGFDIYEASGGPSRYTNVHNMGYPINTSADELYYIKDPVGKPDAYVVSNRIGSIALKNPTCCDDIWRIQYEPRLQVLGKAVYTKTQQNMRDVVIKLVDETGTLRTFNSADGNFSFNTMRGHDYVITGDKPKFASTRATVSTQGIKRSDADQTVTVTVYMDSIDVIGGFSVSNVYYDFDVATPRADSRPSLDSLANFMKDNPSLSVEVFSFADSKGSPEYNKDLSLRRAQSVINYMIQSGVAESRMLAKALGESHPAAPNTTRNGNDNPAGRALNRRTEFRIVKDEPTRRVIFNSAQPGTIDSQEKNLRVDESYNDDEPSDKESESGRPGSRVNKDQNP